MLDELARKAESRLSVVFNISFRRYDGLKAAFEVVRVASLFNS